VACIPLALHVPALATLGGLAVGLLALILYERARFAELRERLRARAHPAAAAGADS
jgi:hypothetical protein